MAKRVEAHAHRRGRVEWVRTVAIVALSVAGVSGVLGRWAGSYTVAGAGGVLLVAPVPEVFHDHNISVGARVELRGADGSGSTSEVDREMIAAVSGPLARLDAYVHALLGAPQLPPPLWTRVLGFGLCGEGPLVHVLGSQSPVEQVAVELRYASRPNRPGRQLVVYCLEPPSGILLR